MEVEHRWPGLDWTVLGWVTFPVIAALAAFAGVADIVRTADGVGVAVVAIVMLFTVPVAWLMALRRNWQRYGRVLVEGERLIRITRSGRRRVIPLDDLGAVHRYTGDDRAFVVVERLSGKRPWAFDTNEWRLGDSFWAALGVQPPTSERAAHGFLDVWEHHPRVREIGLGEQSAPLHRWLFGTVLWALLYLSVLSWLGITDWSG